MSDWIPWSGGECPVAPDALVDYKMRDNTDRDRVCRAAGELRWSHMGYDGDIIAYRVVQDSRIANAVPEGPAETILQEAQRLVHGDRGEAYGHPHTDYSCTADMWRALIKRRYGVDVPLSPDFACLMMVAVKLSREAGKPKRDNRTDGCGYFECADMCLDYEKKQQE